MPFIKGYRSVGGSGGGGDQMSGGYCCALHIGSFFGSGVGN